MVAVGSTEWESVLLGEPVWLPSWGDGDSGPVGIQECGQQMAMAESGVSCREGVVRGGGAAGSARGLTVIREGRGIAEDATVWA